MLTYKCDVMHLSLIENLPYCFSVHMSVNSNLARCRWQMICLPTPFVIIITFLHHSGLRISKQNPTKPFPHSFEHKFWLLAPVVRKGGQCTIQRWDNWSQDCKCKPEYECEFSFQDFWAVTGNLISMKFSHWLVNNKNDWKL